jgi:hypothetical protein
LLIEKGNFVQADFGPYLNTIDDIINIAAAIVKTSQQKKDH